MNEPHEHYPGIEGRLVGSKRCALAKAFPDGVIVRIPPSYLLLAGAAGAVGILAALGRFARATPKEVGRYGGTKVTPDDYAHAREDLGPIITPMEQLVGVPLLARSYRDVRLELAVDAAAPASAGISNDKNAQPNWHIPLFELSSGEVYVRCFGPAMTPPTTIQDYWRETDGSQQTVVETAGTRGAVLKAQALAEGYWPPRKLTADEKAYGNTGPP